MKTRGWLLLATIAAAACGGYDAPSEVVLGSGVYTQPAPAADFKPLRTYYIDPSMDVWKDGEQQLAQTIPAATVTAITTRMAQYKYTQVGAGALVPPSNADVGLRLALFNNSYSYYYSYCGAYWYGWYGCWPSWGYAGSYSTGTVAMLMVDLRPAPPPTQPPPVTGGGRPVLWATGLYAVLQGTTAANSAVFNAALNRAFDQSPYLQTSAP